MIAYTALRTGRAAERENTKGQC